MCFIAPLPLTLLRLVHDTLCVVFVIFEWIKHFIKSLIAQVLNRTDRKPLTELLDRLHLPDAALILFWKASLECSMIPSSVVNYSLPRTKYTVPSLLPPSLSLCIWLFRFLPQMSLYYSGQPLRAWLITMWSHKLRRSELEPNLHSWFLKHYPHHKTLPQWLYPTMQLSLHNGCRIPNKDFGLFNL